MGYTFRFGLVHHQVSVLKTILNSNIKPHGSTLICNDIVFSWTYLQGERNSGVWHIKKKNAKHGESNTIITIASRIVDLLVKLYSKPIAVAVRSEAENVFASSNTGIVGSNPTRDMDAYLHFYCVCVFLCRYSCASDWTRLLRLQLMTYTSTSSPEVTRIYFQQTSGVHAPVGKRTGCSLSGRSPAPIADSFHVAIMARKYGVLNLWEININNTHTALASVWTYYGWVSLIF
jgi:hypothetical protein